MSHSLYTESKPKPIKVKKFKVKDHVWSSSSFRDEIYEHEVLAVDFRRVSTRKIPDGELETHYLEFVWGTRLEALRHLLETRLKERTSAQVQLDAANRSIAHINTQIQKESDVMTQTLMDE